MKRKFMGYIFPSMLSFLLTGIYSIIDGIFVGRAMGDPGLAAINIAWPLVALTISLGTGIGMGAAVIMSLNVGAGQMQKAKKAEASAFLLLLTGGIVLVLLLALLGPSLLFLLGAKGELLPLAWTYLRYVLYGALIQIFATGMIPLMRNHGAAVYSMFSMASGCVANIFLDYLLVLHYPLGLKGAAIATVLGQFVTLLFCFAFFLKKENRIPLSLFRPDRQLIKSILRVALSPFGLTYLPSVTIILMNLQTLRYGGEEAVSAYAVLAYIISFMELLVQGIGDGSQPLLSVSEGKKDQKSLRLYARLTFSLSITLGIAGAVLFYFCRNLTPVLYGTSKEAAGYISYAAPAFALIMAFYGLTKPAVSYLYATHKILRSNLLVYGEILLTLLFLFLLPVFFGLNGVWYTIPAVQGILSLFAVIFLTQKK